MSRDKKPSLITAYWDVSDPSNKGWSWRAFWTSRTGEHEHEESGGFEGRESLSESTVASRARKAAGYPRSRIPVEVNR